MMMQLPEPEPSLAIQLAQRLRALVLEYDFEFAELLGAFAALCWGFWVLSPWWSAYTVDPAFSILARLIPEWVVGMVFVTIGTVQLIALVSDFRHARKHGAFVAAFLWLSLTSLLCMANYQAPAWVLYGCLALTEAWAFLRIVADRRSEHRE